MGCVKVTAKAEYAVRAMLELATTEDSLLKGERIARSQGIPLKFLENILVDLRHANLVHAQRGAEGGYRLAREPEEITLGEVIRAVEGPLASVRGEPPERMAYEGSSENLRKVWVAVRASLRSVLDNLTLADVVADRMPEHISRLTEAPDAWLRR
jgi:Rrf2 family protein